MVKKKSKSQHKEEGNIAIFTSLGIYSEDPKEDENINKRLIKFLKSQGYKMPDVKVINNKNK